MITEKLQIIYYNLIIIMIIIIRIIIIIIIIIIIRPPGLLRSDNKRPDGVTLIPWKQGKCLAWDVTMPDTYGQSHLPTQPRT